MMAGVLEDAYADGELSYVAPRQGQPGFLSRAVGPCAFCVNDHWKFPLGCPYGKPGQPPLPGGLLDKAAAAIVKAGAKIDPEVAGDVEMLQDLIVAASNEAVKKVDDEIKGKMGGMLGGLGLPPGMF